MAATERSGDSLTDGDLQYEIELVGELVVAATSSEGPMAQDEIDRLLGVTHPATPSPTTTTPPSTEQTPEG